MKGIDVILLDIHEKAVKKGLMLSRAVSAG